MNIGQSREFFPMNIRPEQPSDYREVENLVRESFWNVYRPGALEHYVLHRLRDDPAFVRELDFVMEKDGRIVGQNVFVRARATARNYSISRWNARRRSVSGPSASRATSPSTARAASPTRGSSAFATTGFPKARTTPSSSARSCGLATLTVSAANMRPRTAISSASRSRTPSPPSTRRFRRRRSASSPGNYSEARNRRRPAARRLRRLDDKR